MEFNFQWENLPSPSIEYTNERVNEFLKYSKLSPSYFRDKMCLDAGCGNGRYTYAMLQLGAKVVSFDISSKAVESCRKINSNCYFFNLMELRNNPIFDFVLCWGVLHHLPEPRNGFNKIASQVKSGGILHIMVYHKDTQKIYEKGRLIWSELNVEEKTDLCRDMINKHGGSLHSWWDAFNPKYNWSYRPKEIKRWFKEEGFKEIKLTKKFNINMRGVKL